MKRKLVTIQKYKSTNNLCIQRVNADGKLGKVLKVFYGKVSIMDIAQWVGKHSSKFELDGMAETHAELDREELEQDKLDKDKLVGEV